MPVPNETNNSLPFFGRLMDDKNLISETQVVKDLFVLEILNIIQPLLHQH